MKVTAVLDPEIVPDRPDNSTSEMSRGPRRSWRAPVLGALAAAAFVAALLGLGLDGLIPLGLLLVLSIPADHRELRRAVTLTRRNLGLAAAMSAAFAWFWLWHLALTESTLVGLGAALIAAPLALQDSPSRGPSERTVVLTRRSCVLAVWALVVFVDLYYAGGNSFTMLAAVCLVLPIVLAVSRARESRRRGLEFRLLRHPLDARVRPHLAQGLNIWLCCALLGGVIAAGGAQFVRIAFSLSPAHYAATTGAFAAGLILLGALAFVPRRRVYVATNLVIALLSGFLALQLGQLSTSHTDAVVLDSPLTGEWFVLNGGGSVLLNGHSPNESNAVDFLRLGSDGLTHPRGSGAPLTSYAGFGWPVLAPADGRIVEVTDDNADTPPGTNGDEANHLVIDIGGDRFVAMAHLKQGSVTVVVGDVVRRGQQLAVVGNSGHSNEPHLHLQVQDSPVGTDAERTFPMVFRDVEITRGGVWPWGDPRAPRTGDLLRGSDPPAEESDLFPVDGETAHLQCQGSGSPTVVLLGGMGFTTTVWAELRADLGPDVRTCAWDYPGVGHSTGQPPMTASRAASSLHGTLRDAGVPFPVVLVGHSVAGLTTRLYVAEHPAAVGGVVLFDPTVASFARSFDEKEFQPRWDGTASAAQVEAVTAWPDVPFEILLHDPAVYASAQVWSDDVEARWGTDQASFAGLAPRGTVTVVSGAGHNVFQDAPDISAAAVRRVLEEVKRAGAELAP